MRTNSPTHLTRLAPSPTGHLHLGHVLHLLYVQGLSHHLGTSILLRLEDHDRIRCQTEFESSILEDLEWLGFEIPSKLWRQSERDEIYEKHLNQLIGKGLIYACRCSRKEIQIATSQSGGELTYPGTCRDKNYSLTEPGCCLRIRLGNPAPLRESLGLSTYGFHDLLLAETKLNTLDQVGDLVVRDRLGNWSYQFTVVIDDLEQNIDLIIRGIDLLPSTPGQLHLRSIIAPDSKTPTFAHHPLIYGEDGKKLAKRDASQAVSYLRRLGLSRDEVRGLAAKAVGLCYTPPISDHPGGMNFTIKNN
jgi:glutamyl-Q tRNA(Asp) synthetase